MANISVNLYDGHLDVSYDCSGAIKCKYALWEDMPIDDDEHCIYRYCGSCRSSSSQNIAIENVKMRLTQYIKLMEMGDDA